MKVWNREWDGNWGARRLGAGVGPTTLGPGHGKDFNWGDWSACLDLSFGEKT